MADPKGQFYGGGNTGLATILPRESRGTSVDTAFKLGVQRDQLKAREQQLKAKQQADMLKDIKDFKAWRYYQPTVNRKTSALINDIKGGLNDPLEIKMRTQEIASLGTTSLQLQEEAEAASQMYKQDKKVVQGDEYYLSKYHSSPDEGNLKKLQTEGLDPYGFLQEDGGSKYVNTQEAFTDVINNSFKDFVKQKTLGEGSRKYIGRGLQQITQDEFEAQFRNFAKVNAASGAIEVKDVDELINDGVLTVFMDDPYTKRVLQDRALELAAGEPVSEQHLATALKEQLSPRSAGTVSTGKNIKTARESVDFASERESKAQDRANDWLRKARAGEKEGGWDELIQTEYEGFTIQDVKVDKEGGIVTLIMTKPEDVKDEFGNSTGQSKIKNTIRQIPFSSMTDSGLLGFYSQALNRRSGARINDEERPDRKGLFDNLNISNEPGELN